ncbi:ROK family protein [Microbacterium sp.]|uniref:ROK family protein n=1 Tax=Microbacterium sp. TaxID=51671 RepID=UPI0039E5CB66
MRIDSAASPGPSLKLLNAAAVLNFAWDHGAFTASDAIAATGLTRTTVIGLCVELVDRGWLIELPDTRVAGARYRKGRPARRYALHAKRAVVVGIDAGLHTVTTRVVDLRGEVLALSHTVPANVRPSPAERIATIDEGLSRALASAGVDPSAVLCLVVGIPAPTDARGESPRGWDEFWQRMNPGLATHLRDRGRQVILENDANLAAIGEGKVGAGVGVDSYVTLLTGERLGAGFVLDGRLVRGSHGGAGEMHPLIQLDGVWNADGIAAVLRGLVQAARNEGRIPAESVLSTLPPDGLDAEAVLHAADDGDPLASAIVDELALRLARVSALLAGMLDVERIIFAGGVADSLALLLSRAAPRMAELMALPPPELVASALGSEVVGIGAVGRGLAWARENLLSLIADYPVAGAATHAGEAAP